MPLPIIALMTDFGTRDSYVGMMKGVIVGRCPDAHLIDITHEIAPQNIRGAAYRLWTAYRHFPASTVFLVVVDPGVGTVRRPIAVQTNHGVFVGPDNGVFSAVLLGPALDGTIALEAVTLHAPPGLSNTFHGRDLFAPVAADLACGRPITEVGTPIDNLDDLKKIEVLRADLVNPGVLQGEIIDIDYYGNVITSLGPFEASGDEQDFVLGLLASHPNGTRNIATTFDPASVTITLGNRQIDSIRATYGTTQPGEVLALVNSAGMLEIAVNMGNAAEQIGAKIGDNIQIQLE